MKGKMTTGAGKPSRSEPWKQTPESRPPPAVLSLEVGRRGRQPHSHLCFSPLPLRSGLQTVGERGVVVAGTMRQRSHVQHWFPGMFLQPSWGPQLFLGKVRGHIPSGGREEGGSLLTLGGGAEEAWRFDLPSA